MRKYVVCVILASLAFAWCGNAQSPTSRYSWWKDGNSDGWGLFEGDNQVGFFDGLKYYPRYGKGLWGEPTNPPIPYPAIFGVEREKIANVPRVTLNGKEVSREQAIQALEARIPDDANKLRLTIIGPEPARKQVLNDLKTNPDLIGLAKEYVIQDYSPDNPLIQGLGFVTNGNPTIYLQSPDGGVLHRQDDYQGVENLAMALRRARSDYDKKKDPDLTKRLGLSGLLNLNVSKEVLLAVGGVVALLLFLPKRE